MHLRYVFFFIIIYLTKYTIIFVINKYEFITLFNATGVIPRRKLWSLCETQKCPSCTIVQNALTMVLHSPHEMSIHPAFLTNCIFSKCWWYDPDHQQRPCFMKRQMSPTWRFIQGRLGLLNQFWVKLQCRLYARTHPATSNFITWVSIGSVTRRHLERTTSIYLPSVFGCFRVECPVETQPGVEFSKCQMATQHQQETSIEVILAECLLAECPNRHQRLLAGGSNELDIR